MVKDIKSIRNFCIIAHIDHGKSTLADRLLELTNTVEKRKMQAQLLDQMDLEKERGITIKLQPVRLNYNSNGKDYVLNLIDTPGHVDFTYEVSRSIAACEGALLLVDATKGVQAQTIANLYLALEHDLEIVPIINKIDLPNANVEKVCREIVQLLGCKENEIMKISAKTGEGVAQVLEKIVEKIPAPKKEDDNELKALIFDSVFSEYKGAIAYIRIFSGSIKIGDTIKMMSTEKESEVLEVGVFKPKQVEIDKITAGEVGYVVAGLKEVSECRVGDTMASPNITEPLPGYKEVKPMVFASFYPENADDFDNLKDALGKLKLNDASLDYEVESSKALGRGFRCGFLGLLHLEIITERLKREFGLTLTITVPSVAYKINLKSKKQITIFSAADLPDLSLVDSIAEPWVSMDVISPSTYVGKLMELMQFYRGQYKNTEYLDETRSILHYDVPLAEVITDFYDKLKSVSSGYASVNYEISDYKVEDLVRLDVLVANDLVLALSRIIPKERVMTEAKSIVKKLKNVVPQQSFQVSLQAAIGGKIIAREDIKAMRKDVIAKLYGGDVTRKKKLLEKQKKGKRKMKELGRVRIPQEAFLEVLKK
ncbi:MAG: translation elongation factor 4 [Patescibacteria group bacterium]|nr:translation elongation factor 4 [Patescibacteria group bacterium]